MIRFQRPHRPAKFEGRMHAIRAQVEADVVAGVRPTFTNKWRNHRRAFSTAQFDKCGYCESQVRGNQPGGVEHRAPKSALQRLDQVGAESTSGPYQIVGRSAPFIASVGYWWLAYDWRNWLYVCTRCNGEWKNCVFPVEEDPRTCPPQQGVVETPLLLDCFEPPDPADHLIVVSTGQISERNGSPQGRATIDTCGLDRESLRVARYPVADDTLVDCEAVLVAMRTRNWPWLHATLDGLCRTGGDDRPFAGTVRAVMSERLRVAWARMPYLRDAAAAKAATTAVGQP